MAEVLAPLQSPISPEEEIFPQAKVARGSEFPPALENYILTLAPYNSSTSFQNRPESLGSRSDKTNPQNIKPDAKVCLPVSLLYTEWGHAHEPPPAGPRVSSHTWVPPLPDPSRSVIPFDPRVKMAPLSPLRFHPNGLCLSVFAVSRKSGRPGQAPPQGPPGPGRDHLSR